jgi:hypothetical protein
LAGGHGVIADDDTTNTRAGLDADACLHGARSPNRYRDGRPDETIPMPGRKPAGSVDPAETAKDRSRAGPDGLASSSDLITQPSQPDALALSGELVRPVMYRNMQTSPLADDRTVRFLNDVSVGWITTICDTDNTLGEYGVGWEPGIPGDPVIADRCYL